mmetsp:Transcript_27762/g.71444  ORF Transcript_27762/g.71444 Transcript_27762/m.71444 type:complete len:205 (-) Transcript_27762:897-1511(-)
MGVTRSNMPHLVRMSAWCRAAGVAPSTVRRAYQHDGQNNTAPLDPSRQRKLGMSRVPSPTRQLGVAARGACPSSAKRSSGAVVGVMASAQRARLGCPGGVIVQVPVQLLRGLPHPLAQRVQRQDAEGLLQLHRELLDAEHEDGGHGGGGDGADVVPRLVKGVPQRERHQQQPHGQEARGVPRVHQRYGVGKDPLADFGGLAQLH